MNINYFTCFCLFQPNKQKNCPKSDVTHLYPLAIFTPKRDSLVGFIIMDLEMRPQQHTVKRKGTATVIFLFLLLLLKQCYPANMLGL